MKIAHYLRTLLKDIHFLPNLRKLEILESLRKNHRHQDPKSLIPYGHKIYSQNDEDGIIREIFNRIGTTNKTFVELGVGDGLENNTLALLFDDWKGLWVEGSSQNVDKIAKGYAKTISGGQLTVIQSMITKENINDTISSQLDCKEPDLLSIDLDGNDYHVFEAISGIKPRVVVMEYNAKFAPPVSYCMQYDAEHIWDGTDKFGASLSFLEARLREKGYSLVGCNLTGANAFFVRQDLVENKFLEPFTAEKHYEPARYLGCIRSGHPASYATIENRARK